MPQEVMAVSAQVDRGVRPRAWLCEWPTAKGGGGFTTTEEAAAQHYMHKHRLTEDGPVLVPLYDQAAIDAAADDAARQSRDAEAQYWRSLVDRLTIEADSWNLRYMEMVRKVADGLAMQPAAPLLVSTGPNVPMSRTQQHETKHG